MFPPAAAAAEKIQISRRDRFTCEYDPHLYFKRAIFGDPTYHRELAQRIGS